MAKDGGLGRPPGFGPTFKNLRYSRPGLVNSTATKAPGTRSLWHTRAIGMVPVSDAPRRWSDCTVPPLADADSCDSRRRLHPPVASPVAAGTRVYARLETLNFRALGSFRNFFDRVSPKPRRRLSARSDARSSGCDRRLLHAFTRPFRAPPSLPLGPQLSR
jgi:hypothetical protein